MANIAYVRVSTVEQNEQRQIEALNECGIDKWFVDKASGKNVDRPQYKAMMEYIREGDVVYIHDYGRLARNTRDLLNIVDNLSVRGIEIVSIKENINTKTPTGKLMLSLMASINEFEREAILERQREGIEIAKRNGKYNGRKRKVIKDIGKYYELYMQRKISKPKIADELKISRPTLDKYFKEYEDSIIIK